MLICSDPQEGSIVQCLDMAVHEVEAFDGFDVTVCSSGVAVWGYMGQDGTQMCCCSEDDRLHFFPTS